MTYELRNKDLTLLKFEVISNVRDPEVRIIWYDENNISLLPLDLELTDSSLSKWLKHRTIPRNRAYVNAFLAKCGLNINRPLDIIMVSKGLSLNDCFWVTLLDFPGTFDEVNLYDNKFNSILSYIAFTGFGSSCRASLHSSPEFTTTGMLPKCWRRIKDKVQLYKGATSGASNSGYEPYSEFYASQIAQAMGLEHISYNLHKWKGILCSTCDLFTSKDFSFIPVGRIITSGGFPAVIEDFKARGNAYYDWLVDMVVFDAVICNTDRHYGNFGFMINNDTNKISAPAPLFDHGNSLFNFAGSDCWQRESELQAYIDTLQPAIYDDFLATAKEMMTERNREQLRHLLSFKFQRHPTHNLPAKRLRMIEKQVQKRARLLLE